LYSYEYDWNLNCRDIPMVDNPRSQPAPFSCVDIHTTGN